MSIVIGRKAPDFKAPNQDGNIISLKDFKDSWIVLYFYPKDDTEGCTKEACSFRDNMEDLTSIGAVVIGVSPDGVKSHGKFIKKYDLNFNLVSDENKKIVEKYGVWAEKSMYGRKYMGVLRTTFIINPKGKLVKIYDKVKVEGHTEAIIEDIKALKKKSRS